MKQLTTDYRALPRVSNSDLTRLKEGLSSHSENQSKGSIGRTKVFGRAFHQHLLEPETVGTVMQQFLPDVLAPAETGNKDRLLHAIWNDAFCQRYLRLSERERVVLWDDPTTGLPCKTRLDMVHTSSKRQKALIIDLKPTAARTQAQFLESCYTYDYDRQAAFYLDSLRYADTGEWANTQQFRFVFVGVNKAQSDRLFAIDATSIPGFVDYGRKKYRFWLRKWREENTLDIGQRTLGNGAQPLYQQTA